MPTYTYRCTEAEGCPECGGTFETFHSMTQPALTVCPNCPRAVKRIVSMPQRPILSGGGLSDARFNKSGMTKYQNIGDGKYEKVAGPDDSPAVIDRNKLPSE